MFRGPIKRDKVTSWPTQLAAPVEPVAEPVKKRVKKPVKRIKRSRITEMIAAPIIREPIKLESPQADYSSGFFGLSKDEKLKLKAAVGENKIKQIIRVKR